MPYESRTRLRVRSYELDSYGHVNHAVYVQWLEHGRSRLLQDKGYDYHSVLDAWGVRMVTVSVKIDYRRGLALGDEVEIATEVARFGRTSVAFRQRVLLLREGAEIEAAEASCTMVFTGADMGTPVEIPQAFRALYG